MTLTRDGRDLVELDGPCDTGDADGLCCHPARVRMTNGMAGTGSKDEVSWMIILRLRHTGTGILRHGANEITKFDVNIVKCVWLDLMVHTQVKVCFNMQWYHSSCFIRASARMNDTPDAKVSMKI